MARQRPYLRHLHSLKQPPLPVVFIFKMNTVPARHLPSILDLITSFAHPALREQGSSSLFAPHSPRRVSAKSKKITFTLMTSV